MKAVQLTAPYQLEVSDVRTPRLDKATDVLLDVEAVGICGSDVHQYRGVNLGQENTDHALILGHEISARVVEAGKQVTHVRPGDRVAVEAGIECGHCEWCRRGYFNLCENLQFCGVIPYDGALCEQMVWPGHLLFPLAPDQSYEDGVMAEIFGVALHSIDLAAIRPGMTAAVLGSGPVGVSIQQMLRNTTGVTQLFATDLLDYRLDFAHRVGEVDEAIHARQETVVERILDSTNGRGVDVVFECAGESETVQQAVELACMGGKVIWVGIPETEPVTFITTNARRKGLTIRFVRRSNQTTQRVLDLMQRGGIDPKPFVTHHFALDETVQGYDLVDHYADNVIKAVIHPQQRILKP